MTAKPHKCPLCDWVHISKPLPSIEGSKLDQIFGAGVLSATWVAERMQETERALREHLSGHRLEEWAAKVVGLKDALRFCRDVAQEVYIETSACEVAMRHIIRKAKENL